MNLYEAITYEEYIETMSNYDLILKEENRKKLAAINKFMGANIN